ncbi:MAG: biotin/lipoyl-containing protein [Candidatus Latescibacteria bacterium]|jgi:pyruvate/2-oxoglutarate dehydrogenase complex dihydrolipoamide acyltransferase (E2) component|nr:biotin/lipoyl-containing protein [Candidatus Latescibacterota bacterium]
MNIKVKMPDLSATEGSEIAIGEWRVEVGQRVKRGDVLLEVETDKAVQEVECFTNGTVTAIHVQPGDTVSAGDLIATIQRGR